MNRRIVTLIAAVVPIFVLGLCGALVRVPFVALGPGPTYNTLGIVDGKQVVDVQGTSLDPVTGHLNMTTVLVRDQLSVFEALGFWLSSRSGIVPRSAVNPPDKTRQQIEDDNAKEFRTSEDNAELATLGYMSRQLKAPSVLRAADVTGPALSALAVGDELVSVNGAPLNSPQSVTDAVRAAKPGSEAVVVYRREGKQAEARIKLGERPDDKTRGFLGVTPAEFAKPTFTVDFNLAQIGGPSAGLMFSLSLIDKLTPGELSGGKFIAGTGTITTLGEVGPIGGIQYKMMAAREAGAVAFLVPADNCAEAQQRIPDGLRLIKVAKLDDAVSALNALQANQSTPSCG